jgi:hypothetical protein
VHAMKEYEVMEVELIYSLFARWVGRSASRHGLFYPGKEFHYSIYRRLVCGGGDQSGRFCEVTLLLLPRIEPLSSGIQPVA